MAGYGVQPGGTRSMPLDQAFRRGRAGRARRLGVASLFIGVLPAAVLLNYSSASMPSVLIWFSAIALPLCMWLWIRLPFTGVTLTSSHVVATSWWSRRKYERGAVERFRAEPYTGFFFVFGWAVYDGRFESGHLVLEFADGRRRPLGGDRLQSTRRSRDCGGAQSRPGARCRRGCRAASKLARKSRAERVAVRPRAFVALGLVWSALPSGAEGVASSRMVSTKDGSARS